LQGEAEAGMGLAGMRDRARLMGGFVTIESPNGGGVVVEARFATASAAYVSGKIPATNRNSARENI
jgi:signal transduction histidine kinase